MHLEGLSGHRSFRSPLLHSAITQKCHRKQTNKQKGFFFGRGGGTTQPLEQWQTSDEVRETGLQLGHEAASAGGGARRAGRGFRGWKMAQRCKKPRDFCWRLSRLGVIAGCCHLMAAGRAAKMVLGKDWQYFSPTVQQP